MYLPCPHCGFLLAMIDAEDGAAQHCPRCEGVIASGATAAPEADQQDMGEGPDPDPNATTADADADADVDPVATLIACDAARAASIVPTSNPLPPPQQIPSDRRGKPAAPSFARRSHAAIPLGPRWPGLAVIAALLLVLAVQLLLVERAALAASAQWRPMISRVCAALQCELPPWHEPSAITMLDRGVQPHPGRPRVLAVQASFRNDARWPQPWPTLLLSLADIDGNPVAQGEFAPHEYGAPADAPPLLAPGQAASIRFAVREPEPRTVAFSFEFR